MQATSVRWTIHDLELFSGDQKNRYEIINGELFVTKSPHWNHQSSCVNVSTVLKNWSDITGLGRVAIAPGIIFSESDNVIPDVVWVSNESLTNLLDESGNLIGAPELVIEVLSPGKTNEQRDKEAKLKLYSVQGVKEYWICDYNMIKVEVYRRQQANLTLVATLFAEDELTSPLLPGFQCIISQFFV